MAQWYKATKMPTPRASRETRDIFTSCSLHKKNVGANQPTPRKTRVSWRLFSIARLSSSAGDRCTQCGHLSAETLPSIATHTWPMAVLPLDINTSPKHRTLEEARPFFAHRPDSSPCGVEVGHVVPVPAEISRSETRACSGPVVVFFSLLLRHSMECVCSDFRSVPQQQPCIRYLI